MEKLDIACLIDNDPMYKYLVSRQMRLIDFCDSILVFNDDDEALKYLRPIIESPETLPSVILLDVNMPVLDGWHFSMNLQNSPFPKKTMFISSVLLLTRQIISRQPNIKRF